MMRSTLAWALVLAGCATVPVGGEGAGAATRVSTEVVGHVTDACRPADSQSREPVTLRAAGELDALDTTRTDESGAFHFRVMTSDEPGSSLFIEARGYKALARPQGSAKDVRVAELTLPCDR